MSWNALIARSVGLMGFVMPSFPLGVQVNPNPALIALLYACPHNHDARLHHLSTSTPKEINLSTADEMWEAHVAEIHKQDQRHEHTANEAADRFLDTVAEIYGPGPSPERVGVLLAWAFGRRGIGVGYAYDGWHRSDPTGPATMIRMSVGYGLRRIVWDRDGWECVTCGTHKDLTVDHVVPVARGGTNDIENLQTMCRSCNCRKGAR